MTIETLTIIEPINKTSNNFPAGVSASKIISCSLARNVFGELAVFISFLQSYNRGYNTEDYHKNALGLRLEVGGGKVNDKEKGFRNSTSKCEMRGMRNVKYETLNPEP